MFRYTEYWSCIVKLCLASYDYTIVKLCIYDLFNISNRFKSYLHDRVLGSSVLMLSLCADGEGWSGGGEGWRGVERGGEGWRRVEKGGEGWRGRACVSV